MFGVDFRLFLILLGHFRDNFVTNKNILEYFKIFY